MLAELIGAPGSVAEQNRKYAAWHETINTHQGGARSIQLVTGNALWVQQGERLEPDYQKVVAQFYHGALSEVGTSAALAAQSLRDFAENFSGV